MKSPYVLRFTVCTHREADVDTHGMTVCDVDTHGVTVCDVVTYGVTICDIVTHGMTLCDIVYNYLIFSCLLTCIHLLIHLSIFTINLSHEDDLCV